jgi:hypothetical protein
MRYAQILMRYARLSCQYAQNAYRRHLAALRAV